MKFNSMAVYTCDKQVLWESAVVLFFQTRTTTSLVSARKSHSSGVRGLVVRCLPFNPEGSGSNLCVCANFFYKYSEAEGSHFFGTMRLHPFFGFVRLFFRKFISVPKGSPFIFLILCNRTNVEKFQRVLFFQIFRHYETVFSFFFENFSKDSKGSPFIFFEILQQNGC